MYYTSITAAKFMKGFLFNKLKNLSRAAFSSKYLILTNTGISVCLSGTGDAIEQHYELMTGDLEKYNNRRTLNMSLSGMVIGIICHHWYNLLDRSLPGRTIKTVCKKVLVDQVICSPICISTFFITLSYLENDSFEDFKQEVRNKAWRLYAAEWVIWPPAQVINFYILPTKYRVLYDNTISLGYDVYTSYVKHNENKSL